MVNVSKMVQMLLDRMDKFPEEFVSPAYSAVKQYSRDLIEDARWGYVSIAILDTAAQSQGLFTAEECNAYRSKIMKIMRNKYEADVCEELVRPAKEEEQADPRQGQLWQTPHIGSSTGAIAGGPLTMAGITRDALKILEDEMFKNNKPTKLIT
jgi:hypothetical protein